MMNRKIRVAVVDDGVDASCVPLAFRYAIDNAGLRENTSPVARSSHGTTCARIIRKYYPAAEIGSIAILNENLKGDKNWLFAAIDVCEQQGVDIIHLSLGSTNVFDVVPVREKIRSAGHMLFVCAQSNSGEYTVPAFLPEVISVRCDRYYTGPQFSVEGGHYVRAGSAHDLEDGITPVCNSFAAPLVTAKVCEIIEKTRSYDVFDIYKQLYRRQNAYVSGVADERMKSIPKVCITDKDFRLKDTIRRLMELFLEDGYSPLLLSNHVSGDSAEHPYFAPVNAMQYIERQIYFSLPVYPCDIVVLYTDEVPGWDGFDVRIAEGVMTRIDHDENTVSQFQPREYKEDAEGLFADIVRMFE